MLTVLAELCKTDSGLRMPLMPCCLSSPLLPLLSLRISGIWLNVHSDIAQMSAAGRAGKLRCVDPKSLAGAMMSSGVITVQSSDTPNFLPGSIVPYVRQQSAIYLVF